MDEEENMEFALNSDFDSELLNCWEKSPKHDGDRDSDQEVDEHGLVVENSTSVARPAVPGGHRYGGNWGAASDRMMRLPSFTMEDESMYQKSLGHSSEHSDYLSEQPERAARAQSEAEDQPDTRVAAAGSDSGSSKGFNTVSTSNDGSVITSRHQHQHQNMRSAHHPGSLFASDRRSNESSSIASSPTENINTEATLQDEESKRAATGSPGQLHPLGIPSSATCPPHVAQAAPAPAIYPTQPELMPLAFNALAAGMNFANPMLFQPQLMHVPGTSIMLPKMQVAPPLPPPPPAKRRRKGKGKAAGSQAAANVPPPFLLFDAPVELRANFINAQRAHGLPVMQDNNAYHYGMAVNGFHPQDHLNGPAAAVSVSGSSTTANPVRLIDGRHGNQGMKRMKNAKEQKRAQRITDLIEQLREKMEMDGWKVGMKSKFHTLSSCADYVKHLTAINKEKEEAVKKAQCDLEATKRKLEGARDQQDDGSDPESTTSSLTDSSGGASGGAKAAKAGVEDTAAKAGGGNKNPRLASRESSISSSMCSGGDDSGNQAQALSMSDLTDSNIASSTNSGNEEVAHSGRRSMDEEEDEEDSPSSSSVSSNAAVKSVHEGISVRSRKGAHADVVIQKNRKRKQPPTQAEATSLEGSFELDYEEVFLNSNVPQLLATTSGKVIAWNDFFLRVTGFSKQEMDHLTIFSLVQSSDLSSVFGIVAAALRTNALPPQKDKSDEANICDTEPYHPQCDYEAVTLPCVKFRPLREGPGEKKPKALNMTLTLMADEDPRKRCFHGIFTDCAGKNGLIGSISPELLSLLVHQKKDNVSKLTKRSKKSKGEV